MTEIDIQILPNLFQLISVLHSIRLPSLVSRMS
jgi:hypothetical protein